MLNRFRETVRTLTRMPSSEDGSRPSEGNVNTKPDKYPYSRPAFLNLNHDEVQVSRDFGVRPIIVPRDVSQLPLNAGYAEAINGGKSDHNEDQAVTHTFHVQLEKDMTPVQSHDHSHSAKTLATPPTPETGAMALEDLASYYRMEKPAVTYFAIFDGHAGTGAAIMASRLLHIHLKEKLEKTLDLILAKHQHPGIPCTSGEVTLGLNVSLSVEDLVKGALEAAFIEMDKQIGRERTTFRITGGCTALAAILFLGKLYVANAGDCRAILCHKNEVIRLSREFTPETERQRLAYLAYLHPELLHGEFTYLEFPRRLVKNDLGKQVLYRGPTMSGWSTKVVQEEDVMFPLINGTGKRARLMATIGVTRGFGDHDLSVFDSHIKLKPFLSPAPEVQVYDLMSAEAVENDILVMASDGLWDVVSNEAALKVVRETMGQLNKNDILRCTSAAQELVMQARGLFTGRGWKTRSGHTASFDDITVFVIPIYQYVQSVTSFDFSDVPVT